MPRFFARRSCRPVLCLVLSGLFCLCAWLARPPAAQAAQEAAKPVVLYTAVSATTPQIPFWAAVKAGWPQGRTLDVRYWKNLDDLRGVILAGKGDIWLGHLEGFAQVAARGAPITLVAVTGWKKFYFLSTDPAIKSLDELAKNLAAKGERLGVAPPDSPALAVLQEMAKRGGPVFPVALAAPQQLTLEILRGSVRHALMPEPLVTVLLAKKPDLRVLASLEEEFARRYGGPARLPLVGFAVRTQFLRDNPALMQSLVAGMQAASKKLEHDPKAAVAALPDSVQKDLGPAVIEQSLRRDLVLAEPAWAVREEVLRFLRLAAPEFAPQGKEPPKAFFMEQPR